MAAEPRPFHPVLRRLHQADVERVAEIEASAYPFPWTAGIFSDCIRVGYECWGLLDGSSLIGYTIQSQAAGECHLLNLCVMPQRQRQGLGQLLLDHALRVARQHACRVVFLEVRPSNIAGQNLYLRNGFRVIGMRPAYYRAESGREDALVMQRELAT
jgi:ribosomal-protein-alanine N-acetyltransferase